MSQDASGDNSAKPAALRTGRLSPSKARLATWIAVGGLWLASLGAVIRVEILQRRESADVRALVDSARLAQLHASARYAIRVGNAIVGSLESTVSGGQHEEQLAYVIDGHLSVPQAIRLKGVVLAGWDRRPQRLVLEATFGAARHRVEGTLRPDAASGGSLFEMRYTPPASSGLAPRAVDWVLPEAPILAPGPLPIPEFAALAGGQGVGDGVAALSRDGAIVDPVTGTPLPWSMVSARIETLLIAGRPRDARRHDVKVGAWQGRAWTEANGFPLRLELPGSVTIELVEEKR